MAEQRKLPLLRPDDSAIEGGLAGVLGGLVFGGPVGALIGLGTGILSKRMREYQIDALEAEQELVSGLDAQMQGAVTSAFGQSRTPLDSAQLDQLTREYASLRTLSMSPDPNVRAKALEKMAQWQPRVSEWMQDIEDRSRTVFDRDVALLDEQAQLAQQTFREGLNVAQSAAQVGEEMHRLLNDESFDVNNPLNRARLGTLLNSTPGAFFADPMDFAQLLQDAGARVPLLGVIPQIIGGIMQIEEFDWTPEDWRKVAFAMQQSSTNYGERVMADAANMGQQLDAAASGFNHVPPVSYLDRIVTGQVQDATGVSGEQGFYQRNLDDAAAKERAAQREEARQARARQTADYGDRARVILDRILGRNTAAQAERRLRRANGEE